MGIEPTSSAWKAEVLPLNYTRLFFRRSHLAALIAYTRFVVIKTFWIADLCPTSPVNLVEGVGFEPT